MIPYGRQDIYADRHRRGRRGAALGLPDPGTGRPAFEQPWRPRVGAPHAVAVNSATSALHIACLALGLGPGDLLWTVPNTFVASANCARYCGADVDFVDIDPRTWNISVSALADKLDDAERDGPTAEGRRARCISPASPATARRSGRWRERLRLSGHRGCLARGRRDHDGEPVG